MKYMYVALIAGALAANSLFASAHSDGATGYVDTLYSAPGGMVMLARGEEPPQTAAVNGVPLVLSFRDAGGVLIRVYAGHSVTLEEGRAYLDKIDAAKLRVTNARRRVLQERAASQNDD